MLDFKVMVANICENVKGKLRVSGKRASLRVLCRWPTPPK